MSTHLTQSESKLLDYLRNADNSRRLSAIANSLGIHYCHASRCLRKLKQTGLVKVHYDARTFEAEVVD